MCYNAEISLNTFIFGIICAFIVIILNKINIIAILFTLTVTLIQLMEYYTWKNIENRNIIYLLSIIGFFIIFLQIFILNYGYLNNDERYISLVILLILIIYLFHYNYQNNNFYMEKGTNGHLIWHWIDIPLPLLLIILVFYLYPAFRYGYIIFILMIILLSISLYNYYKYKTWGSMWCYIGNSLWLLMLFKSLYLYKRQIKK